MFVWKVSAWPRCADTITTITHVNYNRMQYGIKLLYLGVQMNRHGINGSGCIEISLVKRIFSLLLLFHSQNQYRWLLDTRTQKFSSRTFIRNFVELWRYVRSGFFSSIWRRKSSGSTAHNIRIDNSFLYRCPHGWTRLLTVFESCHFPARMARIARVATHGNACMRA